MDDERITYDDMTLYLRLFIKSWMQVILYERNIYPKTSFEQRNSFNLLIPWTRHPSLDDWLNDLINSIINDLDQITTICLIVHQNDSVKERYILDLAEMFKLNNSNFNSRKIKESNKVEIFNEFRNCLFSLIEKIRNLKDFNNLKFNLICESINNEMNNDWVLENNMSNSEPINTIALNPIDTYMMNLYSMIEIYE